MVRIILLQMNYFDIRHGGDVREVEDHEATALNEGYE